MSTHNLVKTKSHLKKLSIQECVFSFFFKKRLSAGFLSNTFKFNQRCSAEFSGAGRKTLNEM